MLALVGVGFTVFFIVVVGGWGVGLAVVGWGFALLALLVRTPPNAVHIFPHVGSACLLSSPCFWNPRLPEPWLPFSIRG